MNHFICSFFRLSALIGIILLWGCKENPVGPTADEDVSNAYTTLEDQMYLMATSSISSTSDLERLDFSKANKLYVSAVSTDKNNASANFGAGLTGMMMIYMDPAVNDIMKRWENTSLNKRTSSPFFKLGIPSGTQDMCVPVQALAQNLAKIVQTAVVNPPLIGEMQDVMRDNLLPHIDYALERFVVVEQDPSFEFKISGKMQGNVNQKSVYLDNTEVYIMDGVLRGLKAMVEQFLVYRFDLPAYTSQALVTALQPSNTTFFYRASDGVARSQSVMADLTGMIGKFKSAITYLKSETDDQSDDIIKIAQSGVSGIPAAALDTTLVYLDKIANTFSTPQNVTLHNADIDGNSYDIQVNIKAFYNNPPLNPKTAWFPAYTVDTSAHGDILWHWTGQDYNSFNFPDPTFSGLFTGMTNANLKRIMHIDEAFAWRVDVSLYDNNNFILSTWSVKLVINGTDYFPKRTSPSYYYGKDFTFFIMDNPNQQAQFVVLTDGVVVPLELSRSVIVALKNYLYITADLTLASQNITATPSQSNVSLYFNNYGYYEVEKAIGSSAFSIISSLNWWGSNYYDYNVTRGDTYRYRAKLVRYNDYYYSDYIYAYRPNNYTNTVSVTIP